MATICVHRVGNALLSDLRRMDKRAEYYREKLIFILRMQIIFVKKLLEAYNLIEKRKKCFLNIDH